MVVGLVAASPILRAENSVPATKVSGAFSSAAVSDSDQTWADPPRYGANTASISAAQASPAGPDVATIPRPASFTLLSQETTALLASADFGKPEAVQAVRRHRAAKVATRARSAPSAETPASESPASAGQATATPPQKDARIDPIGDLLRGLGIGRDS
ncbi:hypothetical protein [Methylorubrum populi]|nr:hypothetical protein [Methylorubrum populi]